MNRKNSAFTLIELLVSTALSLLIIGAVVQMFGKVSESITDSRSMLEMADRLRLASMRLQQDLAGIAVRMSPPRKPESNEGYFEYIEGSVGVVAGATPVAANTTVTPNVPDSTVGDNDDILMFTTRSIGRPFVGKCASTGTIQSDVAEVAWFVRGRTLHRRTLLVTPQATLTTPAGRSFYGANDISARIVNGNPIANTLGDLTMRENRFAHPTDTFPFDVTRWGQLRLPTLCECSVESWTINQLPPVSPPNPATADFWGNDPAQVLAEDNQGRGARLADDVILTNVIGFDVKAFDLDANDYVDLGYTTGTGRLSSTQTCVVGNDDGLRMPRVYDTWSSHYEAVGAIGLTGTPERAVNGFDDNSIGQPGYGIVDDDTEKLTAPPYPVSIRGIQVKIRVFEPDSRQIREITVVQDFLSQ